MRRAISPTTAMLALASILLAATPALAAYGAIAWDNAERQARLELERGHGAKGRRSGEQRMRRQRVQGHHPHRRPVNAPRWRRPTDGKFVGAAARKTKDEARLAALANCQKGKAGDCIVRVSDCNK